MHKHTALLLAGLAVVSSARAALPTGAGQSFSPSVTGTTLGPTPATNGFVNLTDFTFVFSNLTGVPTSLYLTTSLPGSTGAVASSAFASSIGDYTDLASDPAFSNASTRTYHFGSGATLDTDLTYFALFSTSSTNLSYVSSNPYAGGQYYYITTGSYNGSLTTYDSRFAATFSAVPEPSTYAALAGLAVLGLAWVRRRRQA